MSLQGLWLTIWIICHELVLQAGGAIQEDGYDTSYFGAHISVCRSKVSKTETTKPAKHTERVHTCSPVPVVLLVRKKENDLVPVRLAFTLSFSSPKRTNTTIAPEFVLMESNLPSVNTP